MPFNRLSLVREIFNKLDFGMILIDCKDKIVTWNDFISIHAQKSLEDVKGENLFSVFPHLPKMLLSVKFKGVRQLKNVSKVSWEQRPVLFEFTSGGTMLQNCDFLPIEDPDTGESFICIIIHDVTDLAKTKLELNELIKINKSLDEISNYDALTEIYNRRYIQQTLNEYMLVAKSDNKSLYVCMFDLDKFKNVNDTYGHVVGDRVLQYVSEVVTEELMENISFGRYGGEEFMIIFLDYSYHKVLDWLEKVRVKMAKGDIFTTKGDINITASFGFAEYRSSIKDDLEFIHNSDVALYRSKRNGRNQITFYNH